MEVTIKDKSGIEVASMTFPNGEEYYAWEAIKYFCKAYKGLYLEVCVSHAEG